MSFMLVIVQRMKLKESNILNVCRPMQTIIPATLLGLGLLTAYLLKVVDREDGNYLDGAIGSNHHISKSQDDFRRN